MRQEKYKEVLKDLAWAKEQINELTALFNYKNDSMINLNQTRALSAIDCAIESLNNVKRTIKKEVAIPKRVVDINKTAEIIIKILENCEINNVSDGSGYFIIKELSDGSNRAVDVIKAEEDGNPYYVVFCSYEDDGSEWKRTETLSLDELVAILQEFRDSK